MTTATITGIESFLVDACRELNIPVRQTSRLEWEIQVPGPLRREFGNLASIRATTSIDLRREDPDLEFLAPGSFLLECLTRILARTEPAWSVLVAGVVRPVGPDAYTSAFTDRFFASDDSVRVPGKIVSGFRLKALVASETHDPYVRVLVDAKVTGRSPIHEIFPVVVRARTLEVLPADCFFGRPMYDRDELQVGQQLASLPQKTLTGALDAVADVSLAKVARLSEEARKGSQAKVAEEEAELRSYYKSEIRDSPENIEALERTLELKVQQLRSRHVVETTIRPISISVVHNPVVRLHATFTDERDREYVVELPTIPGRPEVPDDAVICGHAKAPLAIAQGEGLCCTNCVHACRHCQSWVRAGACEVCVQESSFTCPACAVPCAEGTACVQHVYVCASGERRRVGAEQPCSVCGAMTCPEEAHRRTCDVCATLACTACAAEDYVLCSTCGADLCAAHVIRHPDGAALCSDCSWTCAADGGIRRNAELSACGFEPESHNWFCSDHLRPLACVHGPVCETHHVVTEVGFESVCPGCVESCTECARTTSAMAAARCSVRPCDAILCQEHATNCTACGSPTCSVHRGTGQVGASVCRRCGVACNACEGATLWLAKERAACQYCLASPFEDSTDTAHPTRGAALGQPPVAMTGGAANGGARDTSTFCNNHLTSLSCGHSAACPAHLVVTEVEGLPVCRSCALRCVECARLTSVHVASTCSAAGCKARLCAIDANPCTGCGGVTCPEHRLRDSVGQPLCFECGRTCATCGDKVAFPASARGRCSFCDPPALVGSALRLARPVDAVGSALQPDGLSYCLPHLTTLACLHGKACSKHHVVTDLQGSACCAACVVRCDECSRTTERTQARSCEVGSCRTALCQDHAVVCSGCRRPACSAHRGQSSDGKVLCSDCGQPCSACGDGVFWDSNHRRSCAICDSKALKSPVGPATLRAEPRARANWLCHAHQVVLDCPHGPACAPHAHPVQVGLLPVCATCVVGCDECGRTCSRGRSSTCNIPSCSRIACADHERRCSHCGGRPCSTHLGRDPSGLLLCFDCGAACASCGDGVLRLDDERRSCRECTAVICMDHSIGCASCNQDLCTTCAIKSPFHLGSYCAEHLGACRCCGTSAVLQGWPHELCELCSVFVNQPPDPPLPFDETLLQPFLDAHAGWRKTKAQLRWSVGERYVLVWVKTAILGTSKFGSFDLEGHPVDVCRPTPQKEWIR